MSCPQKRRKPEPKSKPGGGLGLASSDTTVLNVIKSKKETAILKKDLKKEAQLPDTIFNKSLNNLLASGLIKEVAHVQFKGRKYYIAADVEASEEITGGFWYSNGELDKDFINALKDVSFKIIHKLKVATADGVYDYIKKTGVLKTDCSSQKIRELLNYMVLDNMIMEVVSTGSGEFHSIPVGELCYKCQAAEARGLVSIPCGVCEKVGECTPNGLISPTTCIYFAKWLDF